MRTRLSIATISKRINLVGKDVTALELNFLKAEILGQKVEKRGQIFVSLHRTIHIITHLKYWPLKQILGANGKRMDR